MLGHFADHAGLRPAWSAYVVGVKRKVLLVYEVGVKIHFSPNTGVGLWAKIPNTSTFVARALGYNPLVLTIPEQRQNPPMSQPQFGPKWTLS